MAETIKIGGEIESTATGNKVADVANIKDKTKGNKSQAQINAELETALEERYTKSETYNKTQLDNMITTPEIAYKDYDTYADMVAETVHPAGAIYRVANYDGTQAVTNKYAEYSWDGTQYKLMAVRDHGIDDEPTAGSDNLVKSGGVQNELALGAVYDVSAKNPTAGPNNDGKWESLSALLSDENLNTLIPTSVRKGGMSIKFVCSSDNKYVQYFLTKNEWSTNVDDWQGVDTTPIYGSKNLAESGGVAEAIRKATDGINTFVNESEVGDSITIQDNSNNIILSITSNGVDVKNLKSNGENVATESELDEKQDVITGLGSESIQSLDDEVTFLDDNNEEVAEITPDGIKAKAYFDINGEPFAPDDSLNASKRYSQDTPDLYTACRFRKYSETSKDLQLLIVTDNHADIVATTNAKKIAECFPTIDAVICLGDIVLNHYNEPGAKGQYVAIADTCTKPWYTIIGNHDVGNSKYVGICATSDDDLYNAFIKYMVDKEILSSGEYQIGKPYYFHDFTSHSIRMICLNEYDEDIQLDQSEGCGWEAITYDSSYPSLSFNHSYNQGDCINAYAYKSYSFRATKNLTTPANAGQATVETTPCFKMLRGKRAISQTQMTWFINTLKSTPSGYKVIVCLHNPFSELAKAKPDYKFSQNGINGYAVVGGIQNVMETDVIAEILNAFNSKSTYTAKVRFKGEGAYMNTINDSQGDYAYEITAELADFTNINVGTNSFMCYLGGHSHKDLIWEHDTFSQLQVCPICTTSLYYTDANSHSDVMRTAEDGRGKDAFTLVSFDTNNRALRLNRIGVKSTIDMYYRDIEKITL